MRNGYLSENFKLAFTHEYGDGMVVEVWLNTIHKYLVGLLCYQDEVLVRLEGPTVKELDRRLWMIVGRISKWALEGRYRND